MSEKKIHKYLMLLHHFSLVIFCWQGDRILYLPFWWPITDFYEWLIKHGLKTLISSILLCEHGSIKHSSYIFCNLICQWLEFVLLVLYDMCPIWLLKSVLWQMAPENIRWGSAYQAVPNQVGWLTSDSAMPGTGRRGRFHETPNGINLFNFNHIDVPNTGNLVKKVCWSRFYLWN